MAMIRLNGLLVIVNRFGTRGASYCETNQWYIAREQPPHLSCITPSTTAGRPMEEVPYTNGAFTVGWTIGWIDNSLNVAQLLSAEPQPDLTTWLK